MRTALNLVSVIALIALVGCVTALYAASLDLRLEPETLTILAGEELPVTMRLINRGDTPVRLVKPGDGSNVGWRTPVVGWSIIDARLKRKQHPLYPQLHKGPRCGNINALTKDDLVELLPGQQLELRELVYIPILKYPGVYRVAFHYRNVPDYRWGGIPLPEHDPEAMDWIKHSTEVVLWSNEITVTVKESE